MQQLHERVFRPARAEPGVLVQEIIPRRNHDMRHLSLPDQRLRLIGGGGAREADEARKPASFSR